MSREMRGENVVDSDGSEASFKFTRREILLRYVGQFLLRTMLGIRMITMREMKAKEFSAMKKKKKKKMMGMKMMITMMMTTTMTVMMTITMTRQMMNRILPSPTKSSLPCMRVHKMLA